MRVFVFCDKQQSATLQMDFRIAGYTAQFSGAQHFHVEQIRQYQPELLLFLELRHKPLLNVVSEIQQTDPLPIVVFTQSHHRDFLQRLYACGATNVVVKGYRGSRLPGIVSCAQVRFDMMLKINKELVDMRRKLEDRTHTDRAKGILMRDHGLDEATAYAKLRQLAMNQQKRIGTVAKEIIDSAIVCQTGLYT